MHSGFELNPTFSFTLLGSHAIYLWTKPKLASIIAILSLAVALHWSCISLMGGVGGYYGARWISWGAFLGLATIMVIAVEVCVADRGERRTELDTFYAASVFPVFSLLIGYTVPLYILLCPKTYDTLLLAVDARLGFQPGFLLGKLLIKSNSLWGMTTVVYYMLPFMASVIYASHRLDLPRRVAVLPLYLSMMVVGFALYPVYPAVGPAHAFPDIYPNKPPSVNQIVVKPLVVPNAPRNCMPSLHMAAALIILWNSRNWPWWGRAISVLFSLGTTFATLALGEHYFIDLVVAFPFALAFQAGWTTGVPISHRARRNSLLMGALFTLGWYMLLAWPLLLRSSSLLFVLIIVTIALCFKLEANLAMSEQIYGDGEDLIFGGQCAGT
jgi:hypothetical protein